MDLQAFMPEGTTFRQGIVECENRIKSGEFGDPVDFPVKHYFTENQYIRELHIPAGGLLTGVIHKDEYAFILSSGELEQITEIEGLHRVKAPFTCVSIPGAKRMGYALTDSTVVTVHATNEKNVSNIESELFFYSYEDYDKYRVAAIHNDYHLFLQDAGLTADQVDQQTNLKKDLIPFPDDVDFLVIRPSVIHGIGMFTVKDIEPGEAIAPARLFGFRTPAGRCINHSPLPNTYMMSVDGGDLILVAGENIKKNTELTLDYRQVLDVNLGTIEVSP